MNINKFNTIGYFIKNYFNGLWIILIWRAVLRISNDSELIREVSYRLGDRGIPAKKAIDMVNLL